MSPTRKELPTGAIPWATDEDDPWLGSRRIVQVRPQIWRWLAPFVGSLPALEIGPGVRPTLPPATSHFLDRSGHALGLLAAEGGSVAQAGTHLPFEDDRFAAVLAFEVIEHVEADDELLAEMARVLRPGGRLVLSVPIRASMWTTLDDVCHHVRRYEPEELFAKLEGLGLEVGGYDWHAGTLPLVYRIRAWILVRQRRLVNRIGETLAFPLVAAWQRRFATLRWISPRVPVPAEAEHLMLWAQTVAEGPASAARTASNDATATST
ncbi:MAG TPA: class I SAM-dependent methyltransferase [Actinomycetota bacterium]